MTFKLLLHPNSTETIIANFFITDIYKELRKVEGVVDVTDVRVTKKTGTNSERSYSSTSFDGLITNAYIAILDFDYLTRNNDTITGNDYSNILDSGRGNDIIYGEGGNDTLDGEEGNDKSFFVCPSETRNKIIELR